MPVLFETAVSWLLPILILQGPPALEISLQLPRTDDVYFGSIADADLWPDGRMAVLDGMAQEILVFGSDGGLQARLGGKGGGPGELVGAFNLEIGPKGDLLVLDGNAQRITRWGSDGVLKATTPLREVLPEGSAWPTELSWNGSGLYIKAISFRPDTPGRILKYHEALSGSPEVLAEFNEHDEGSPTCDFCTMTVDPGGRVLAAAGDTLYRINLLNPGESGPAQWRRDDLPATRRTETELEGLRDAARGRAAREGGGSAATFSPFKPRFSRETLAVDSSNRLWVLPSQEDTGGTTLDVFDDRGHFLGSVRIAERLARIWIRNGHLLGAGESDAGEPILYRYRIRAKKEGGRAGGNFGSNPTYPWETALPLPRSGRNHG